MNAGRPPGIPKSGGRKAGTPNKKTRALEELCLEIGIEPFRELLYFAKGDWKALGYPKESYFVQTGENTGYEKLFIEPPVRMQAIKEACSYLYPKRKAIEHSVDPESPGIPFVVTKETIGILVESARKAKDRPQGDVE